MAEEDASDLYLTVGLPPIMRGARGMTHLAGATLAPADLSGLISDLTTPEQIGQFSVTREFNMSLDLGERMGRFRVNLMHQRGQPAIVLRRISAQVPTMEGLGLPPLLGELARERRGLPSTTADTFR